MMFIPNTSEYGRGRALSGELGITFTEVDLRWGGDRSGVAKAISNMGGVYRTRGEYDRALECYERHLMIAHELGDHRGTAYATGNMGTVYLSRGEYHRALECYHYWLRIVRELGDRVNVSIALGNIGWVYFNLRDYDSAIECFEQQSTIARELGDSNGTASATGNMGNIYITRGEYDRALECYQQQLMVAEELGNRKVISIAIGNMGSIYFNIGEHERALECFRQASEGHRTIGFFYGLTYWLMATARALLELVTHGETMPTYLPNYVPGADHEMWHSLSLQRAREQADECVTISHDISKPDTLVGGNILLARIDEAEGNHDVARKRLYPFLEEADEPQRAELHYWLWTFGEPGYGQTALALYEALNSAMPQPEYQQRIDELIADVDLSEVTNTPE